MFSRRLIFIETFAVRESPLAFEEIAQAEAFLVPFLLENLLVPPDFVADEQAHGPPCVRFLQEFVEYGNARQGKYHARNAPYLCSYQQRNQRRQWVYADRGAYHFWGDEIAFQCLHYDKEYYHCYGLPSLIGRGERIYKGYKPAQESTDIRYDGQKCRQTTPKKRVFYANDAKSHAVQYAQDGDNHKKPLQIALYDLLYAFQQVVRMLPLTGLYLQ